MSSKYGPLFVLTMLYFVGALVAGSMRLDGDEFSFVREPYEMLGGDYTVQYVKEGEYANAAATALKAYYFFWKYRPLFSPRISESDRGLFADEEQRFGYRKPAAPDPKVERTEEEYRVRLIVPEPDRFYSHGAGKPLLGAVLNVLPMGLVAYITRGGPNLLTLQFERNHHPVFILVRLMAILSGLATLMLLYLLAYREWGREPAIVAAALFVAYPPVILYFANIHHDAYMVPFLLGAAYAITREKYMVAGVCLGLALAAKNTAVFFLPAIIIYFLWKHHASRLGQDGAAHSLSLGKDIRGIFVLATLALVTLAPFANPVSYFHEVLTPIIGRDFDPRGEDVETFSLGASISRGIESGGHAGVESGTAKIETLQGLARKLLPWNAYLGFVMLAILVAGPRIKDDMVAISFFFLLMMFPHNTIFGAGLGYRTLLFSPFFAIVAARFTTTRWGLAGAVVLAAVSFLMLADPFAARGIPRAVF